MIDQMLRAWLGNEYDGWVARMNSDPAYSPWDEGIARGDRAVIHCPILLCYRATVARFVAPFEGKVGMNIEREIKTRDFGLKWPRGQERQRSYWMLGGE